MDINKTIDNYHLAWDDFSRGNSDSIKKLYSHRDDVMLANPFGHTVVGWRKVADALDYAASQFKDGEKTRFQTLAKYLTSELAIIFEIEKWKMKVGERNELSDIEVRVSTTFRNEDGEWKIIHRHADPIKTFNADGPLRGDL
jgi:ketosteroid isomerase-like protein